MREGMGNLNYNLCRGLHNCAQLQAYTVRTLVGNEKNVSLDPTLTTYLEGEDFTLYVVDDIYRP